MVHGNRDPLFDKLAALDAIGPYEVLRNVPGWEVRFVAPGEGRGARPTAAASGSVADHALDEVTAPDIVLVPGGAGNRPLLEDEEVLAWLREVDRADQVDDLGLHRLPRPRRRRPARGQARDRHWLCLDALRRYGADPVGGRWVEDGKVLTAAGVTAGIDMALHLVGQEAGPEVAQAVQLGIEYDPDPPFDSGSPDKAPRRDRRARAPGGCRRRPAGQRAGLGKGIDLRMNSANRGTVKST